jgi:hypothetical protein
VSGALVGPAEEPNTKRKYKKRKKKRTHAPVDEVAAQGVLG